MDMPDLYRIQDAVHNARRYANRLYNTAHGVDDYDNAREAERVAQMAEVEMRKLTDMWPEIKSMKSSAEHAYDAYVTYIPDCCSCHLVAPCGYCTREVDEEQNP